MGRRTTVSHAHPANRMVAAAIVVMTLVFIMLVSRAFYGGRTVVVTPPQERDVTARAHIAEADTDNDGLADWEEELWGTDPNNPDSDGDGVFDGAERALGSNSDVESGGETVNRSLAFHVDAEEGLTATQAVGRELFGAYMQMFTQDPNISQAEQDMIIKEAVNRLSDRLSIPEYGRDQVSIVAATENTRVVYVENLEAILQNAQNNAPAEYHAIIALTQNKQESAKQNLLKAHDLYKSTADKLAALAVPEDVVNEHVGFVSSLYRYAASLEQIAQISDDPLVAAAGVSLFLETQSTMTLFLQQLVLYASKTPRTTQSEVPVASREVAQ